MDWYFRAWFDLQVAGRMHINAMVSNFGYTSYCIDGNCIPQIEQWYRGKAYIYDNGILSQDGEEEEGLWRPWKRQSCSTGAGCYL